MARAPITQQNINTILGRVKRLLWERYRAEGFSAETVTVTLHLGNSSYKVPNRMIVTVSRAGVSTSRQVWPDGIAGYTKREAYNALRLMESTLAIDPTNWR